MQVREAKDSKALWGVMGGMAGLVTGILLMVPAVTPSVVEVPTPAPTVTVSAEPTPAPSETKAPARSTEEVPAGHRAAAEKAQELLESMSWSPEMIREQLTDFYKFTDAEAEYGVSQLN